jgi:HSP20 family molecular chaperone IbpA
VADRAKATYEDGMLEVEIPLAGSEPGGRRVPIQSSEEPAQ